MDGELEGYCAEKDWASKAGFAPLFLMEWEASMLNVMLEFF